MLPLFLSMSNFMFSLLLIYGRRIKFCFFFWGVLFFIRQMSCILCHIPCVLYVTSLIFRVELCLILFQIFLIFLYLLKMVILLFHYFPYNIHKTGTLFIFEARFIFINICLLVKLFLFLLSRLIFSLFFFI